MPVAREGQRPSFVLVCRSRDGDEVEIQKSTLLDAGLLPIFDRAMRADITIESWSDAEVDAFEAE